MSLERQIISSNARTSWKDILVYSPAFVFMMVGSAIGFFCGALGVAYGARLFWGQFVESVYFTLAVVISGGIVGAIITGLAFSLVSFALTDFLANRLIRGAPLSSLARDPRMVEEHSKTE